MVRGRVDPGLSGRGVMFIEPDLLVSQSCERRVNHCVDTLHREARTSSIGRKESTGVKQILGSSRHLSSHITIPRGYESELKEDG